MKTLSQASVPQRDIYPYPQTHTPIRPTQHVSNFMTIFKRLFCCVYQRVLRFCFGDYGFFSLALSASAGIWKTRYYFIRHTDRQSDSHAIFTENIKWTILYLLGSKLATELSWTFLLLSNYEHNVRLLIVYMTHKIEEFWSICNYKYGIICNGWWGKTTSCVGKVKAI